MDSDGDQLPNTTTLYEYGPNPTATYGGDYTWLTKKTVYSGDEITGTRTNQTDYAYNHQGRLESAQIKQYGTDGQTVTQQTDTAYEYNDQGIRVSKTVDGTKTEYLIDDNNPTGYAQILEEMVNDQLSKTYSIGPDVFAETVAAGQVRHLLYDAHGSTRRLVDATGQPLSTEIYRYDAYGNPIGFDAAMALTTLLYSGEQFDQKLAMQYLRARYYDLATGRFNRLDPFAGNLDDPQSLNKYGYTHGDPIKGLDPTGAETLAGISARVGAFTNMVATRVGAVFAAGGAAIGRFFNSIGQAAQTFARQTLQLFSNLNVTENVRVGGQRIIDFVVRSGDRIAMIEVKYSIPQRAGPSLDRLVGQINAMVSSGSGQPVVWSLQPPTVAQLNRVQDAVGPATFNQVQFVDGVWGLHQYIALYFGF